MSDHTCTKLHVLSKSWFERNTTWIEEFDSSTISKLHVVWYARVSYFHVLWRAIIHVPRNVTMCWKYMYFTCSFTSTCTLSFKSVSACKTIHVTRLVHVVWSVHVVWLRGESCKVHVLWSKKAILQHGTLNNSRWPEPLVEQMIYPQRYYQWQQLPPPTLGPTLSLWPRGSIVQVLFSDVFLRNYRLGRWESRTSYSGGKHARTHPQT